MTSILEPFASKKRPNETGTCSVYASVNVTKNIENNEESVFTIEDDTATTTFSLVAPSISVGNPIEDKNAVNKEYCDKNYIRNGVSELSVNNLIINEPDKNNYYKFNIWNIGTPYLSLYESQNNTTEKILQINKTHLLLNSTNLSLQTERSINFNTNFYAEPSDKTIPQGKLCNLIPSNITSNQLTALEKANKLDNVCPTYQYCENTYAKIGSGGNSGSGENNAIYYTKNFMIVFTPDFSKQSYYTKSFAIEDGVFKPIAKTSDQYFISFQFKVEITIPDISSDQLHIIPQLIMINLNADGVFPDDGINPSFCTLIYMGQTDTNRYLYMVNYNGTLDLTGKSAFTLYCVIYAYKRQGLPTIQQVIWPNSTKNLWMTYMPLKVNS